MRIHIVCQHFEFFAGTTHRYYDIDFDGFNEVKGGVRLRVGHWVISNKGLTNLRKLAA